MDDDSTTAAGWTFLVTDEAGRCASDHHGLYHRDTRMLDRFELAVGGRSTDAVATLSPRPAERVIHAEAPGTPPASIRRTRVLADDDAIAVPPGVYERVEVRNEGDGRLSATLRIAVGTRFDDVSEVRGETDERTRSVGVAPADGVAFSYDPDHAGVHHLVGVALDADAQVDVHGGLDRADAILGTDLRIAPGGVATVHVAATGAAPVPDAESAFLAARDRVRRRAREWWAGLTPLHVGDHDDVVHRSVEDLLALTTDTRQGPVLAAGLPWNGAPLGRQALLAAYMALPLSTTPAEGALRYLAARQATDDDPARGAQPGKIPQEVRQGELAARGEIPHTPSYGSVDVTPLFVVLLHETYRFTGDDALVETLWDPLERAIEWIETRDGFLTGHLPRSGGLAVRAWKDPTDGVVHPDGRPAEGPLALAEVQGYAYDAMRRAAALYREVGGDRTRARALDRQADVLRDAFDGAFWLADERFYALALDGAGEPVRTITSNPGHCLWSGVVPDERADAVVDRLLAGECFSGWGLRTLAAGQAAYDPESDYRGGVWPHDTALAALGMARYGHHGAAGHVATGLVDAATDLCGGLSAPFSGHARDDHDGVVEPPGACEPQAWAAAAPLACLRATEGLGPSLDL